MNNIGVCQRVWRIALLSLVLAATAQAKLGNTAAAGQTIRQQLRRSRRRVFVHAQNLLGGCCAR
jgi:hypothetical protein